MALFRLIDSPIAAEAPFAVPPAAGALVTFEGRVRDHNEGRPVVALSYTAYPALALTEGTAIVAEAIARFGLPAAACHHRIGDLRIGDVAVRVWAAAAHRDDAFRACRTILDEVKSRVPIWKRETYRDGDRAWVACTGDHTHP